MILQDASSSGYKLSFPSHPVNILHIIRCRTHRWETRSLKEHLKDVKNQAMYSVIHGGIDKELRTKSIDYLTSLPFDGYAIGGSLGNGRQELKELLSWMMPLMDIGDSRKNKPRHLLGIADEGKQFVCVIIFLVHFVNLIAIRDEREDDPMHAH